MTTITTAPVVLSHDFCQRCIRFYKEQHPEQEKHSSEIWRSVISVFLTPLHQSLLASDAEAIKGFFAAYYNGATPFGVDLGSDVPEDVYLKIWWQKLRNLCESIGLASTYNPEQPEDPALFNPETAIPLLENHFGTRIDHPGLGSRAVTIEGRTISTKLLESLLVFRNLRPSGWTLEIGAGVGMNAYVSSILNPHAGYLIADLPIMSVVQGALLQDVFGESEVSFYGESMSRIRLEGLAPSDFRLDLAINVDSLPEIPEKSQKLYLKRLERYLMPGRVFYSRNHESPNCGQNPVPNMMEGSSFVRISRCKDWMRDGYIEEVWQKLSA